MSWDDELREKEEANWARVSGDDRRRCVEHLRSLIGDNEDEWLKAIEEPGFHMFAGMSVRNALRDVMPDSELPEVEWTHTDPPIFERNWDDYYMAALREALS